jgi:hypothetical protein
MGPWTGFIRLRIGSGVGVLQTRSGTFGFHKMQGISCLSEDLLAFQEGLCSMEVVYTNSFCSLALKGVNRRRVHTMIRKDKRARNFRKIKISQRIFIVYSTGRAAADSRRRGGSVCSCWDLFQDSYFLHLVGYLFTFLKKKKLVRGSYPHLSFNHRLPTRQTD